MHGLSLLAQGRLSCTHSTPPRRPDSREGARCGLPQGRSETGTGALTSSVKCARGPCLAGCTTATSARPEVGGPLASLPDQWGRCARSSRCELALACGPGYGRS